MKKIELFIKEKEVNITKMEIDLGLPAKSLKISTRGIPNKHREKIIEYLGKEYGYDGEYSESEVDIPMEEGKIVQRVWNKNFIPSYKDGIVRYQDPENGLWKRFDTWCTTIEKETGEIKIRDGFKPATKEIYEDKIGRYYIAENGIKIYKFKK